MKEYLLAIDAGTSSNRTVIIDAQAQQIASAQLEFPQIFPQPGWVEHDPESIWDTVREVTKKAIADSGLSAGKIAAVGITNQRETTVIWDRKTGQCIHNAIVWQDRRTAKFCASLKERGAESMVSEKTGLRIDPYFSATKIAWILEHVKGARERAEKGELAFGTIDTFLLWRLTGGKVHATDVTNASRTLLFNIHSQQWDDQLLALFDLPRSLLPDVRDSAADYGWTDAAAIGVSIPIGGIAGDQHAALIGQAGFYEGVTKSTYGTGCFVMANTGTTPIRSANQLLTTVAYRLNGEICYAVEGSIFIAGSAMQWLRDQLKIISNAADSAAIAERTGIVDNVFLVPAFAGLGAPYWDPDARGAILGLSRDSSAEQIVTATLQAIAYQTVDLMRAMGEDGLKPTLIRVDGGMVSNNWFLQFLADMLGVPVERPRNVESTALGAAFLAGLQAGVYASVDDIAALWRSDRVFEPALPAARREELYAGWRAAVARVRTSS